MTFHALFKRVLLVFMVYSSSLYSAPLLAVLWGGAAVTGVTTVATIGAIGAQKEVENKMAIARQEQRAVVEGNAQLLKINAALSAQVEVAKQENAQLEEQQLQLRQGLSVLHNSFQQERAHLQQERSQRQDLEQAQERISHELAVTKLRSAVHEKCARDNRLLAQGSCGLLVLGGVATWWHHRSATRARKKKPPINPTDHQSEIPDTSHHHPQSVDQSHQRHWHCDG